MNGIHDLGGLDGFTLPVRDPDEPVFKDEWERLVFGATLSLMSLKSPWPLDELRVTIEGMPPGQYLGAPYYARWLWGVEALAVKYGLASAEELINPAGVAGVASDFQPFPRETFDQSLPAKFKIGDEVMVKNEHPKGHTRVPRYARGHQGTIYLDHGVYDLPDRIAHRLEPKPQHCYSVMFRASVLWGARADPRDRVYLDLWDDYLEAVA